MVLGGSISQHHNHTAEYFICQYLYATKWCWYYCCVEDVLTVTQAAERLGVTPARVGHYIKAGQLRAERFGGRQWLLRTNDVDDFAKHPRAAGRPRRAPAATPEEDA